MNSNGDVGYMKEERVCNICKEKKEITEFYRDKSSSGGRMYRCKSCDRKKSKKWQRESGYNSRRSNYNSQRAQRIAKSKVRTAVKSGVLPKAKTTSCADCGGQAREYHHWSYKDEHWLDVVPLCVSCHRARHYGPKRQALA